VSTLQTPRDPHSEVVDGGELEGNQVLVVIFVLVAVLGPEVVTHNPYLRDRIQTIDGELHRATILPCALYPLGTDSEGRDMLSLLLYGARQTLVIAFVAMTMRLLLGLLLGTVAGWWPGSLFDRAITGLIEFLVAIPGLILAILPVFAVGIKRGQVSFVVALSLVGWGEVTQIVRGHALDPQAPELLAEAGRTATHYLMVLSSR